MPRISRLTPGEVKQGALHAGMLLEQIEKRYAADLYSPNMAAAFVLYLIKKAELIDVEELPAFLVNQLKDKQLIGWIKMHIGDHWNDFRRLIALLPIEWLSEYLITNQPPTARESDQSTPETICDLAIDLLKENKCTRVLDPCCGIGNFMVHLGENNMACAFEGHDLSDRSVCLSKIRSIVQGLKATISNENMLEFDIRAMDKFDAIFVDPPLGQRLSHIHMFFNTQEGALPPAFPMVKSTNSTEWIWASKMIDALSDEGRLVIIVSNGALSNMTEMPLRQFFVDRAYIEGVIALPERLLNYANVALSMVIISRKNNSTVKMIDATGLFERGPRVNTMSPLDRSTIVDAFNSPSEFRRDVDITEIAKNNYLLTAQRYFMPEISISNGVPLASLCRTITRGAPLTREEMHEKRMEVDCGARCLTVADIQDGVICDTMPFISGITENQEKYEVHPGDIVLTKAMAPYKVAVVNGWNEARILATANFYILRVNRDLVDPYYLMSYLRSETGVAQLEQIATGTTIRTIAQEGLEKILIPMRDMETQRMHAAKYRARLGALAELREKYDHLKDELQRFYDIFDKEERQ